MIDLTKLFAPFDPDRVSWRVGSTTQDKTKGMALAYIDSRDVMERLDEVCGPGNWECRYPHVDKKTCCEIAIWVGDRWVVKADGAGDSDVEAEKGAFSDAFKRAAVKWGIGRYLYDIDSPWVELESVGRSQKIKADQYGKLRAALVRGAGKQAAPQQADSSPVAAPSSASSGPKMTPEETEWASWAQARADEYRSAPTLDDLEFGNKQNIVEMGKCATKAPRVHKGLQTLIANLRSALAQAPGKAA
jgi:hypothetical protein